MKINPEIFNKIDRIHSEATHAFGGLAREVKNNKGLIELVEREPLLKRVFSKFNAITNGVKEALNNVRGNLAPTKSGSKPTL